MDDYRRAIAELQPAASAIVDQLGGRISKAFLQTPAAPYTPEPVTE